MVDSTRSSIVIAAPPGAVLDVIADLEAYPQWARDIASVTVESEDGDGWPDQATFVVDAGPIKDEYTLDYTWEVAPDGQGVASWTLVRGTMLRAMDGSYTLTADASGTKVVYALTVDLAVPMLGMLRRKAEKVVVDTALKHLRRRVEG